MKTKRFKKDRTLSLIIINNKRLLDNFNKTKAKKYPKINSIINSDRSKLSNLRPLLIELLYFSANKERFNVEEGTMRFISMRYIERSSEFTDKNRATICNKLNYLCAAGFIYKLSKEYITNMPKYQILKNISYDKQNKIQKKIINCYCFTDWTNNLDEIERNLNRLCDAKIDRASKISYKNLINAGLLDIAEKVNFNLD